MRTIPPPQATVQSSNTILLIDSNFLCHQARFALGQLSHDELSTGIPFGFLSRILSLGKMFRTNRMYFCWDSRESYRRMVLPGYKHNRSKEKEPPEVQEEWKIAYRQFDNLRDWVLRSIGFRNVWMYSGLEADDLMAAACLYHRGPEYIIVTSDEDLLQCLGEARLYNPTKREIMTARRFREEKGITPQQWKLVKALAGCDSDCVPGIPGVGEQSAIAYLTQTLPQGKRLDKIRSAEGRAIFMRNLPLVELPHPKTPTLTPREDQFSPTMFSTVCETLGIESFMAGPRWEEWLGFFRGEFVSEAKTRIVIRGGGTETKIEKPTQGFFY